MAEHHEHVNCQEVVERVTDYLERALHSDDAALVEQHLNFCDGCVSYVDQMRTTVRTVGRVEDEAEAVPADERESLLAAFRDWRRP